MKYTYADPTGGGDDITVDIPVWVTPPGVLLILDINNEWHEFACEGEADDDED